MAGGTAGRRATVKVAATGVPVTGEPCTNLGDNTKYRVTSATRRLWDPSAAVVVYEGGVVTSEAYTFNRLTGVVTFETADAGRGAITIDGTYLPTAMAARANRFTFTVSTATADDTDFDQAFTDGVLRKIPTTLNITGTIGGKWSVDTYLRDALLNAEVVLLEFYADRALTREIACWATINKKGLSTAVESVNEYEVEFEGTRDADGQVASL